VSRAAAASALGVWVLALAPVFGGDSWVEVKGPSFTVYGDDGEKPARRVAARFEDMRAFLQDQWAWARLPTQPPVVVVAVRDRGRLRALLPDRFVRAGAVEPAGLTQTAPERTLVLIRTDTGEGPLGGNPYQVVYHEYVHSVLGRNLRLPLWLSEGLAEYWGNTKITDRKVEYGKAIAMHLVTLRRHPLVPLETLFRVDAASPYYGERDRATIFYAESWALVHFLALGAPERKGQLNRLAERLREGQEPLAATREVLGDFGVLQKQVGEYVGHERFQYLFRPRRWTDEDAPGAARTLSPAEALALRGGVLVSLGLSGQGKERLEEALKLDPGLLSAQEALGLSAFRAERSDEARQWLGRAAASGRAGFFTHFVLGELAVQEGTKEGRAVAESELREATRKNPDFAPALALLAELMADRGDAGADPLRLLQRAIELDPTEPRTRLLAAACLARVARLPEARQQAEVAVSLARGGAETSRARQMLATIERMETKAAPAAPADRPPPTPASEDPSENRAALMYQEACDRGEAQACFALAQMLERGGDVPADRKKAAELRGKACAGGFAPACPQAHP